MEFSGIDTLVLGMTPVPVVVSFQFINGMKQHHIPVRADAVLNPRRPDVFQPVMARMTYDARLDSTVLDTLNQLYGTEQVPAPLDVDMPELVFVCQWQNSLKKQPVLRYTRAAHWQESTLRIEVRRTLIHSWISWYVRTVYRILPEVFQPGWYRLVINAKTEP